MKLTIKVILLGVAIVLFVASGLGVETRVNLQSLGLACVAAALLC